MVPSLNCAVTNSYPKTGSGPSFSLCALPLNQRYISHRNTCLSEVPTRRRRRGGPGRGPSPRPGLSRCHPASRQLPGPRPPRPTRPASPLWRVGAPARNAPGNPCPPAALFGEGQGVASRTLPPSLPESLPVSWGAPATKPNHTPGSKEVPRRWLLNP